MPQIRAALRLALAVGMLTACSSAATEDVATKESALVLPNWSVLSTPNPANSDANQLYATLVNNGVEQTGNFDVAYEEWANGVDPDDSILVRCDMAPPRGWNIYHFCSHALDHAAIDALVNYDPARRKADYAVVQREIADQLPFIIIWYVRRLDVINTDFANYKPAHAVTPFWNTWEWSI